MTEVNYWPYIMWPYMCMMWSYIATLYYVTLHVYNLILHYVTRYLTLGDLTLRENASWYVECWARASSDNSPFSEHPNCLNLNHNLSTSAMLTKTKQKIMHAKSVRIKIKTNKLNKTNLLKTNRLNDSHQVMSFFMYMHLLTFSGYSMNSDPVGFFGISVFGACFSLRDYYLASKGTHSTLETKPKYWESESTE